MTGVDHMDKLMTGVDTWQHDPVKPSSSKQSSRAWTYTGGFLIHFSLLTQIALSSIE